ncbi:MAG: hypothetical protein KDA68_16020 [Planctomycetaceae bacterium]|nr:hypothetical protein [Planctomycetaceae bacterium]
MIPELLFTVNPHASDKLITEVLTEAVQQYRREHDISLTRRREDNLKDYLCVWDLREGWDGNAYRSDQQRSLESVASQLRISKSTAYNRYRSAFEQIIGYSYTPTRWWRTMGLLLPADLESWRVSLGRPINRRSRAAVAESRLGCDVESLDQQVNNPFLSTEIEEDHLRTLSIDIHELISRGLSNSEIVARLREDWEIEHEIDESLIESFRNIPYGPP